MGKVCTDCGCGTEKMPLIEHKRDDQTFIYQHFNRDACFEAMKYELKQLQSQSSWVKVSERLPEDGIDVIVTNGVDFEISYMFNQTFFAVRNSKFMKNDITHWQPLPQPPSEVINGE